MRFYRMLAQGSRSLRLRAVLYTAMAGIAMAVMAAVVSTVADDSLGKKAHVDLLIVFIMTAVVVIICNRLSQLLTTDLCEGVLQKLRVDLLALVRRADLNKLEAIGQAAIYDTIARETTLVSESAGSIVRFAVTTIALVLAALYIAFVSTFAFVVVVVLFTLLVLSFFASSRRGRAAFVAANAAETGLFGLLAHLLWGFKEVKMSSRRGDDLQVNHLCRQSMEVMEQKTNVGAEFVKGDTTAYTMFYLLLGTVTFAIPQYLPSTAVAAQVVYMVVFMMSSLEGVLKGLPLLSKVGVALERLDKLETDLVAAGHVQEAEATDNEPRFNTIALRAVTFQHRAVDGSVSFSVGPIDLEIHPGETLFFVGGNGAGKSTLLRIIARLYEPATGSMEWDGRPLGYDRLATYRNLFATVFTDFHLFDRLYGFAEREPEKVNEMLRFYGIGHVVQYEDGRFTNIDLSSGQRKRLALVVALIEDKPILVLDELTADQDPDFRRRYYEEIIPALRAEGRTVLAACHDDRYFHVADRLVRMSDGKIQPEGDRG